MKKIFRFYYDGFRGMTVGKTLWVIILVKLFLIFIVLKLLFFPDILQTKFDTDAQRSEHVLDNITKIK